ncbi:MAG TPA: HAMP domain-containing protein [Nitrospirota bacterium]
MAPQAYPAGIFSRQYYIDRKYQSKMITRFCLLAFVGIALFCACFYLMMSRSLDGGYANVLDCMRAVKSSIMANFWVVEGALMAFLAAGVILLTLLMSHRIAGPLWRIEQTAKAVEAGGLGIRVKLRDKDEMKTLADQMNVMLASLGERMGGIDASYRLLQRDLGLLREKMEDGKTDAGELRRHAEDLQESGRLLLEKFNGLKLS